jgi:hypothetical protein
VNTGFACQATGCTGSLILHAVSDHMDTERAWRGTRWRSGVKLFDSQAPLPCYCLAQLIAFSLANFDSKSL